MCLSPIFVKNTNFVNGSFDEKPFSVRYKDGKPVYMHTGLSSASSFKPSLISYIAVPCSHCAECRQLQQAYLTQRAREEMKVCHCVFITLTYKTSMMPYIKLGKSRHPYADLRDFQLFIKRIRKSGKLPPFKYLCTREFGKDTHRPHFHALLFFEKSLFDVYDVVQLSSKVEECIKTEWKRKVGGTTFNPIYEPLSKFLKFPDGKGTYDCHLVVNNYGKSDDPTDVAYYVTKYALKYDKWLESKRGMLWHNYKDEYSKLWSYFRPRLLISKGFGLVDVRGYNTASFIKNCIDFCVRNKISNPQYFIEDKNVKGLSLSRYYQNKFMNKEQKLYFIQNSPNKLLVGNTGQAIDATQVIDYCDPVRFHDAMRKSKEFEQKITKLYNSTDTWVDVVSDELDDSATDNITFGVPEFYFEKPRNDIDNPENLKNTSYDEIIKLCSTL